MRFLNIMMLFIATLSPLFLSEAVYGQQIQDIRFNHLTVEDGLLSNNVACLIQDSKGFIWIGTTSGGLSRYDGADFVNYIKEQENPKSIANDYTWRLYRDKDDILWIITYGGGLSRYDAQKDDFISFSHDENDETSLSSNFVWSAYVDNAGDLWVGTENGLDFYDKETGDFIHYRYDQNNAASLSHNSVTMIVEDGVGDLWISTYGGGLNKFDKKSRSFTHYRRDQNKNNSLGHDFIWTMYLDIDGMLWIGTEGGLDLFDPDTETFTHFTHDEKNIHSLSGPNVTSIFQDSKRRLWIGTNGHGLNLYDPFSGGFTRLMNNQDDPQSIADDTVWDIIEDSTGTIWFATFNGIDRYNASFSRFSHYKHYPGDLLNLSSNSVQAFYQDPKGMLWIGTRGGGVNLFDPERETFIHYKNERDNSNSLSNNTVFDIEGTDDGSLWIATSLGVDRFDPVNQQFRHLIHDTDDPGTLGHGAVRDLAVDSDGTLWIALYGGGLDHFDPENNLIEHFQADLTNSETLISEWLTALLIDSTGLIWIGTEGGVSRLDRGTGRFTNYYPDAGEPDSISDSNIHSIFEDEKGTIWIGTTKGLNRYDADSDTFTVFDTDDGLAGNSIGSIIADDQGFLWFGTNKGLSKFNPGNSKFRNYDSRDGLQGNQFRRNAVHKSPDGELFFGGVNGFNSFFPGDITDNSHIPPVVLTDFQLFNKSVPIGGDSPLQQKICFTEEITLTHDQSVFSIKFASLNYLYSEKNQYSYIMEGVDKSWISVDNNQRFATYTNLDPGLYIFKVRGSNNDGIWNDAGTSLQIRILPPWWETWWAVSLYILTGFLIIFLFIQYRTSSLNRTKVELELLIDTMPSILIGVDADGRITHWNLAAVEKTGIPSGDVFGKPLYDVLPHMISEKEMIGESIRTGETRREVKKSRQTEKGISFEDITVFPFIANGAKIAVIRIDDVTESVRMEEMMIQNEKMLSVGGLAAGMAHEINNPLAGIIQTTGVLANRLGQKKDLQANHNAAAQSGTTMEIINRYLEHRGIPSMLATINESGKRVSSIVENMLSFARKGEGQKSSHSLVALINKTLKLAASDYDLKKHYDFKNIEIKMEIEEGFPLVICEEAKLQQVFLNLFRNGAQAMQEACTENPYFIIRLRTEMENKMACMEIEDNGPGMNEETRKRIFEPFFTTKPIGVGTGLGLSISYFIITDDHHGEMTVESSPGKGAKFVIRLPLE